MQREREGARARAILRDRQMDRQSHRGLGEEVLYVCTHVYTHEYINISIYICILVYVSYKHDLSTGRNSTPCVCAATMPTVTVVTNVDLAKADAVKLVGAVTDCLYPIVGCPAGYVHVHVLAGQPVSFGGGDCVTPCCQTRIVMAGDCSR